jgi:NAD(P)-dependent dehydrogenase (short-subunit alcohol dehydrogenase family)
MAQSGTLTFGRFVKEQRRNLPVPNTPLDGRVVIVTGSNVGLGLETARHIARLNAATLILAVRSPSKGETAKRDILKSVPKSKTNILVYALDMSDFSSVKAFAVKVASDFPAIDIAILNAGIVPFKFEKTKDGWESSTQVNVLSTAYLATLLLPTVKASYKPESALLPHLTIVASDVHFWAAFKERNQTDIFMTLNDQKQYEGNERYQVTKLLDLYITEHLANWTTENMKDVVVNSVNPGLCHSKLNRGGNIIVEILKFFLARSTEVGSRNLVYAATATGMESHGKYSASCELQK